MPVYLVLPGCPKLLGCLANENSGHTFVRFFFGKLLVNIWVTILVKKKSKESGIKLGESYIYRYNCIKQFLVLIIYVLKLCIEK